MSGIQGDLVKLGLIAFAIGAVGLLPPIASGLIFDLIIPAPIEASSYKRR